MILSTYFNSGEMKRILCVNRLQYLIMPQNHNEHQRHDLFHGLRLYK